MDMNKFEKIDGREALKRLVCGENIFDDIGSTYFIEAETNQLAYRMSNGETFVSLYNLTEMLPKNWYIKKPFDVRQAMLDRPNEWVGKFSVQDEEKTIWYYVGFDSKNFCALRMKKRNKYGMKEPVKWNGGNVVFAIDDDLDACIPIEDVPEEAKR